MKKLLNTLFITQPEVYLSLDGDNIVLLKEQELLGRLPLHNLESVITFGYAGASPALMGYCAERNISIVFLTKSGRFQARVIGKSKGNVVLRKKQYSVSEEETSSAKIARNFIIGKVYNNKWMLERMTRDYPLRIDVMEELRGVYADRFVLSLINKKVMNKEDFLKKENGAVIMTDEARKKFLTAWQNKKQEKITHPYLGEKMSWGLVPYAQALLLARHLRNDLDEYPPFLWK